MSRTTPDPHRSRLGATVRELRRTRGLSARDLAVLLEVSPATISAIESGRTGVTSQRLATLAEVLGRTVGQLLAPDQTGLDRWGSAVAGPGVSSWRTFEPLARDAALAGALEAFVELGYHGASVRVIAERAGLSVPGLYHHHAGKQQMLVALLDQAMSDLAARTSAAHAEGGSSVERFALVVEALTLFHTHRRDVAFLGASEMRSLEPDARARLVAARRAQQHLVDGLVDAAVAEGHFTTPRPLDAARAAVSLCVAPAQWFDPGGALTAEEVAGRYVELALALVGWDRSDGA